MITFTNTQRYNNLPFEEYLQLPGFSHSWLKNEFNGVQKVFNSTDKVKIGKIVDLIISGDTPNISDPLYPIGKNIAYDLDKQYGSMIKLFDKQAAFTSDMCFNGFKMTGKFLLDFLFKNIAVIDLKVTHEKLTSRKKLQELILHMGYHNQLFGYCGVTGVNDGYIMAYSVPLKQTIIESMKNLFPNWWHPSNIFWEDKIVQHGKFEQQIEIETQ
jgi:hypothetical protein